MEAKLLEIRDSATTIPALAIQVSGLDGWLVRRAGYDSPLIILMRLVDCEAHYDAHQWKGDTRTMPTAHSYIAEHWRELKSGDMVDVMELLGLGKLDSDRPIGG
jgi:hypothetical protein